MSKKRLIFALENKPPKMSICWYNTLQMYVVGHGYEDNLLIIKKTNTMKKALLFIGLAMCSSFAFAQTNNYAKVQKAKGADEVLSLNLKELAKENADYKASIFTKGAGDTLAAFNFENAAAMSNILYGDNGLVGNNEVVNGVTLTPNGNTYTCARFQWIQDTNYLESAAFAQTYSRLGNTWHNVCNYFKYYLSEDGGFMLMSLIDLVDVGVPEEGTTARTMELPHAYVQFPVVNKGAEDRVIDIAFTQIHRKFYDQTFIDYKVNGSWKTREINVDGVDAAVNDYSRVYCRYVMPLELGAQSSVEFRFRYQGGSRSNAWGYFWAFDNVAVISGGSNRWSAGSQDWAGGAYGMVPQGMEFPLSWWANVYNAGYYNLTGINLSAKHIAADGTSTEITNASFPNIPSGNPSAPTPLYFNEQGLLYTDSLKTDFYYFYYAPGAYSGGHYMDSVNDPSLGYHGMPSNVLGRNRVAVVASSDSTTDMAWDTIPYRVVGWTSEEQQAVAGYRWGHDNGILPTGQSYHYGYTENGQYITEDGNWDQNGYGVYVRYTTGNTIPTDGDGQPWVLRGMEIVTSAEHSAGDLNGARIHPVTYVDIYDPSDESFYFTRLDNGVNDVTFTLDGSQINNSNSTGVTEATGAAYQSVNIFFPTQPELLPNTSYRVGYQLTSSCTFSAAANATSYVGRVGVGSDGQPVNVYYNYDSSAVSAPWRSQFWPNYLDVLVKDPARPDNLMLSSVYHPYFPMIRAIVGPREVLPDADINVYCEDENAHYINYNGETVCGNTITVPETSGPTFTIIPAGDHMVLDSLFIDGEYVPLNNYDDDGDDDYVAYEYNVYDTIDNFYGQGQYIHTYLERYYWTYTFRNISSTTTHSISATSHYAEWTPVGVDPVAPEVMMHLAPNPATSQVALNIKGVAGMVNCSIIDMSGRTVYNRQINAETANTIDLRNVPAGAYFVRITNDTFSKVEKLIVR